MKCIFNMGGFKSNPVPFVITNGVMQIDFGDGHVFRYNPRHYARFGLNLHYETAQNRYGTAQNCYGYMIENGVRQTEYTVYFEDEAAPDSYYSVCLPKEARICLGMQ